jgi:outer membrane biosynthesis protein TonB
MLPKHYHNRYALIIVLSLLIHALLIAAFFWVWVEENQPKSKISFQVNLQLVKEEFEKPEVEKPKVEKAEDDKLEDDKLEGENSKAMKTKPKKAKPKKAKPKKAKPKKAKPKKAKPKKAKPKKAKPKEVLLNKGFNFDIPDSVRGDTDSAESNADLNKSKHNSDKSVSTDPVSKENQEPIPNYMSLRDKSDRKHQLPVFKELSDQKVSSKSRPKISKNEIERSKATDLSGELISKINGLRMLDDIEMADAAVVSVAGEMLSRFNSARLAKLGDAENLRKRYYERAMKADDHAIPLEDSKTKDRKALTKGQKNQRAKYLGLGANKIISKIIAPKYDGQKYYGTVKIRLGIDGEILSIILKESGHSLLDAAVIKAILKTDSIKMPSDESVVMSMRVVKFWYNEESMSGYPNY